MAKKPKFPKTLFVAREEGDGESWLVPADSKEDHAEIGEAKDVAEYRLVRVTSVRGGIVSEG